MKIHKPVVLNVLSKQDRELGLLREVYEAARAVHRYNGVDKERTVNAYRWLNNAINDVMIFDGGNDERN